MPADPSRLAALVHDLRHAAAELPAAITEHLAALTADLAAARTETGRLREALAAATARAETAETAADESGHAAAAAERDLDTARADADRLRAVLASAEAEIARLRITRGAPRPSAPAERPPHARTPATPDASLTVPRAPSGNPPALRRTDEAAEAPEAQTPATTRIADAFRAWCGAATPVMGKVEFFAGHIRAAVPGASVTAVHRDANSQATPPTLSAQGGASPVEHWLVAFDGGHWLLPQPMAAGQFRELAPCFEGTATPATLATVVPAEVRVVGDRYEVPTPGRVA